MANKIRLFAGTDAGSYLSAILGKYVKEIRNFRNEWYHEDGLTDRVSEFSKKRLISPIEADFSAYEVKLERVQITGRYSAQLVDVAQYFVPVKGDIDMLQLKPSTFGFDIDTVENNGKGIVYHIIAESKTNEEVKAIFKSFEQKFNKSLALINETIEEYNRVLPIELQSTVENMSAEYMRRKGRESEL